MKNMFVLFLVLYSTTLFSQSSTKNLSEQSQSTSIFRKAPYLLYPGSNNKMLILWQLTETKTCNLEWGTNNSYSDGQMVSNEQEDHQYQALLINLLPAQKYYFRLSCENGEIKTGSFYTGATNTENIVSFYAYGDTRSHPDQHDLVARQIMLDVNEHPLSQTFVISTGDMVTNGDNESDWDAQFFSPNYTNIQNLLSHLPYLTAVGNHEGQGVLFNKYFPYPMFSSDRFYYAFDYANVHFVVIDQFTDYTPGSIQYNWIVNELASSDKPWKMIILHMPGWSAGGGHANNADVQNYIQPLCLQYGVSFVITGHNHYYSRANVDGVMHITSGGGGAPLYNPNPNAPHILITDKSTHYCKLDINHNTLTFTARRSDGSIIETFDYHLNVNKTNELNHSEFAKNFHIFYQNGRISITNNNQLNAQYSLYDNWGKILEENTNLNNKQSIAVHIPGIYYVKIYTGKHQFVKRVIVP